MQVAKRKQISFCEYPCKLTQNGLHETINITLKPRQPNIATHQALKQPVQTKSSHLILEHTLSIPAEQARALCDAAAFLAHNAVSKVAQLVMH